MRPPLRRLRVTHWWFALALPRSRSFVQEAGAEAPGVVDVTVTVSVEAGSACARHGWEAAGNSFV
jgi:hypothetical protein